MKFLTCEKFRVLQEYIQRQAYLYRLAPLGELNELPNPTTRLSDVRYSVPLYLNPTRSANREVVLERGFNVDGKVVWLKEQG